MHQLIVRNSVLPRYQADPDETADIHSSLETLGARSRYAEVDAVRSAIRARAQRGRFFPSELFADPAWDMLLELYLAALIGHRLSLARLTDRAGVPPTTAARWIATLESGGLTERHRHRFDKRLTILALSEKGFSAMRAYFGELHAETKPL